MSNLYAMPLDQALADTYREHLIAERNLSENSIRAYLSDLESFVTHLNALGIDEFSKLEVNHLRSWLDRKSTRLNSSHIPLSRMPSSA